MYIVANVLLNTALVFVPFLFVVDVQVNSVLSARPWIVSNAS